MDKNEVKRAVELALIKQYIANKQGYFVPVAVSNRHLHVCEADLAILFGAGYTLKKMRDLVQPGQYACEEQLTLIGPKGSLEKIRVLGPVRAETQVEICLTDSYKVDLEAVIRMSGDLAGTPGGKLIGPAGEVTLQKGVVVSARHLHMSAEEANLYGLKSGDIVSVRKTGARAILFGNVIVRSGDTHALEMHIDADEANAAGMLCGELLELIK